MKLGDLWKMYQEDHAQGSPRVFNDIQNIMESAGETHMDEEDWDAATKLAVTIRPEAEPIVTSNDFAAIHQSIEQLTEGNENDLLNIIFAANVLTHRGLWDDYCAWFTANVNE